MAFLQGYQRQAQDECARLIASLQWRGAMSSRRNRRSRNSSTSGLAFVKPSVSLKTHERYAELCRKNIVPLMGNIMLSKLKTSAIDAAFSKALEMGRRDGTGGLSRRSVHHMRQRAYSRPWGRL